MQKAALAIGLFLVGAAVPAAAQQQPGWPPPSGYGLTEVGPYTPYGSRPSASGMTNAQPIAPPCASPTQSVPPPPTVPSAAPPQPTITVLPVAPIRQPAPDSLVMPRNNTSPSYDRNGPIVPNVIR